jgi:hypothetical protein
MKSLRPAIFLLTLLVLLTGCASDQDKPWMRRKPKWWESEMDPDDRAFYRATLFGGSNR